MSRFVRRVISLALTLPLAIPAARLECAARSADGAGSAEAAHAHHAPVPADSDSSGAEQGEVAGCAVLMCSTAEPAAMAAAGSDDRMLRDMGGLFVPLIYISPVLPFDPPPPRYLPI